MQILEAEARVHKREKLLWEESMRSSEYNWAVELTALQLRVKNVEQENTVLVNSINKLKMALATKNGHLAALKGVESLSLYYLFSF